MWVLTKGGVGAEQLLVIHYVLDSYSAEEVELLLGERDLLIHAGPGILVSRPVIVTV